MMAVRMWRKMSLRAGRPRSRPDGPWLSMCEPLRATQRRPSARGGAALLGPSRESVGWRRERAQPTSFLVLQTPVAMHGQLGRRECALVLALKLLPRCVLPHRRALQGLSVGLFEWGGPAPNGLILGACQSSGLGHRARRDRHLVSDHATGHALDGHARLIDRAAVSHHVDDFTSIPLRAAFARTVTLHGARSFLAIVRRPACFRASSSAFGGWRRLPRA